MKTIDYSIIDRPMDNAPFGGDWGMVRQDDDHVYIAIIDVLGHGEVAHDLAVICQAYLEDHIALGPKAAMSALHRHIKGSRGCVATICDLCVSSGRLNYTSTGNTVLRRIGAKDELAFSQPGTVGYQIRTPIEKTMTLASGDILILHTDGISSFMSKKMHLPRSENAQAIASEFVEKYSKDQDDALCIVLKYDT